MRAAAAQIELELGPDLRIGRFGIPLQQGLGAHHHAGDAISALRRLLLDEGALDRRRRLDRPEAFQGGDLLAFQQDQRRDAGQYGFAVDDHGAGAALTEAAPELRSAQLKIVGEHIEQRRRRINVQRMGTPIDLNCNGAHILVRYAQQWPASSLAPDGSIPIPFVKYNISFKI